VAQALNLLCKPFKKSNYFNENEKSGSENRRATLSNRKDI
jgi:hypothetical protein